MEDLRKKTPIELHKIVNGIKEKHDAVRDAIINDIDDVKILEKRINENAEELQKLESEYVEIIEILTEYAERQTNNTNQ